MLPKTARMLRRAEFMQASRTARAVATPCFIVQSLPASAPNLSRRAKGAALNMTPIPTPNLTSSPILGVTASRKVGNAVARNRAKRRLRALLYQTFFHNDFSTPACSIPACHASSPPPRRVVLVARKACLDGNFASMQQQLEQALKRGKANIS